jgi:hypothetical protein
MLLCKVTHEKERYHYLLVQEGVRQQEERQEYDTLRARHTWKAGGAALLDRVFTTKDVVRHFLLRQFSIDFCNP